ncbi:MAG: outer membrane lipoprotein-sorting protein [Verrucomicrobiia bacterium]
MMGRLALILLGLSAAMGAVAATTNELSEAESQGRQLAQQIWERLEQPPPESLTNTGVLIINDSNGRRSEIPVQFQTTTGAAGWSTTCETTAESNRVALVVIHETGQPNRYELYHGLSQALPSPEILIGNKTMIPFAGSDFWIADLGLEFFHWPEQKILRHEMRRGRACKVLQSTNPHSFPDSYSRVVSWIDNETLAIVQAEAYDAKGKLLKEFYPKDFKKVNGQWAMGEMEMINDQTGSRTRIKFDLKKHD